MMKCTDIRITEKLIYWSLVTICVFALNGFGQGSSSGTITGTVTDSTGSVVPDAEITVTNQGTGVPTVTKTNGSGVFAVPQLVAGTYSATITKPGFQTFSETNIILHPTQVATVNATLKLAQVATNVAVVAQAAASAQVQTSTPEISNQVSGQQANILPLNGRNFQSLSALMPGVVNLTPGIAQNDGSLNESSPMSINGMSSSGSLMTLDGIWNENSGNMNDLTVTPNPDTIDEVRVLQNNYSVRNSLMGANVAMVETKSGTAKFHGSAFEYFRNTDLDARNAFSLTVPTLQQNIFGYTLGGPVYIPDHYNTNKQKTFFFWSQQWIYRNLGSVSTGATPTADMRNGLFSPSVMPTLTTPLIDPTTGSPFPFVAATATTPAGYQIPPNMISQSALAFMNAMMPLPNYQTGGFTNYINTADKTDRQRDDEIKLDHNFTSKLRLMAEYLDERQTFTYPNDTFIGSPFSSVSQIAHAPDQLAQIQLTQTISPTMVNTISASMNNLINETFATGTSARSQVPGFQEVLPYEGGSGSDKLPQINFSAGWSSVGVSNALALPGSTNAPASDFEMVYSDDLGWLRQNHYIDAGINVVRGGKSQQVFVPSNGVWGFSGQFTGNPIADFLLGDAASINQSQSQRRVYGHYNMISPYIQDQWKITHRVTATFGVRITFFPPTYAPRDTETNFVPTLYTAANAPTVNPDGTITPTANYNPLNGLVYNGVNGTPMSLVDKNQWMWGPTVGLAWDVFGDGRTSARAGYGITYQRAPFASDCSYYCAGNYPLIPSITLIQPSFPAAVGSGTAAPAGAPSLDSISQNWQPGEVQSYSVSLEHRFGQDWLVSIAGAGNTATHMDMPININQALPDSPYNFNPVINSGTVSSAVYSPYLGYGGIADIQATGIARYTALEANVRHPVGHNVFLSANYTWSHSLSDQRGTAFFRGLNGGGPQDAYHIMNDYGASNIDVPHVFAFSAIWNLPWFQNAHGAKEFALGGWRYSDITAIQSGFALDPGLSVADQGLATRPDASSKVPGPKTDAKWFNTSAFAAPAAGFFGNAAPGSIRGPGFINFDMALYKDFKIHESHEVEFRAEFFNIFNHTNFNGVSTTFGAGNFGNLTSAADPRIMEFALRYQF